MKKLLGTLALSMAFLLAPIEAATTAAQQAKARKAHLMHKKIEEKKAAKKKAAAKTSKSKKKELTKGSSTKSATKKKTTAKKSKTAHAKPVKSTRSEKDVVAGKTADGKTVYEGARKGHYYLSNGKREYVDNFVGARIVGKTNDGRTIYEGPRGGHFYYTASGNKEYVKRDKPGILGIGGKWNPFN